MNEERRFPANIDHMQNITHKNQAFIKLDPEKFKEM